MAKTIDWSGIPQVSLKDAAEQVGGGTGAFLDVREEHEWRHVSLDFDNTLYVQMGKVEAAAASADPSAALSALNVPADLGDSEDTPCFVLCAAGVRSQRIAEVLRAIGKTHVANVRGGIMHG